MQLKALAGSQIDRLHNASLQLLQRVGVRVPHADMLSRFADAGALVDFSTQVVQIPADLIEHCLADTTKSFTLYGRDHNQQARFGQGCRNYNSIAGEASWVDDSCTQRRWAGLDDVRTAALIGDALPHINLVGAMSDPHELSPSFRCVAVAAELAKNTGKPFHFWWYNRASAHYVIELLITLAGSVEAAQAYPITYPFLEPISPLKFNFEGIDLLYESARLNLPVPVGPMAQIGATAPGTLGGTLAQENAEILAGICITQLIKPGMPVVYGGIPHAFDMKTTQLVFAGPEQALMAIAMTQMGKHYGLPIYINVGLTDSKVPDAQAGMEAGMTLMAGVLAGADIFGHLGICGVDQASSLAMLVMQHEIIGYVERFLRGFEISDETLGLDVVEQVGHDGNFLGEMHTAHHFRTEVWYPQLLDRQFWSTWLENGATSMHERCIEHKDALLASHIVTPLADDVAVELDKIVASARKDLTQ